MKKMTVAETLNFDEFFRNKYVKIGGRWVDRRKVVNKVWVDPKTSRITRKEPEDSYLKLGKYDKAAVYIFAIIWVCIVYYIFV